MVNWEVTYICTPEQPDRLTCQNVRTSFSQAVLWGLVGPKILFKELYPILKCSFLIAYLHPVRTPHPKNLSWWRNNVIIEGLDGQGGAPLTKPTFEPGGYSGPRFGSSVYFLFLFFFLFCS